MQKCYKHWYKLTYHSCSVLMKSRSRHNSTKKGFIIFFTVTLRTFIKYHSLPLFSVTQYHEKCWDPATHYAWRNYWTASWCIWNACIIRFEQLRESSFSLKTIKTLESFKSLWTHYIILWSLWSAEWSTTVCLFHCRKLSQYFKKLYKSVSTRSFK